MHEQPIDSATPSDEVLSDAAELTPPAAETPATPAPAEPAPVPPADDDAPASSEFAAMLAATDAGGAAAGKETKVGDKVKGKIVSFANDAAFVDFGGRAEGALGIGYIKDDDGNLTKKDRRHDRRHRHVRRRPDHARAGGQARRREPAGPHRRAEERGAGRGPRQGHELRRLRGDARRRARLLPVLADGHGPGRRRLAVRRPDHAVQGARRGREGPPRRALAQGAAQGRACEAGRGSARRAGARPGVRGRGDAAPAVRRVRRHRRHPGARARLRDRAQARRRSVRGPRSSARR